MAKNKDGLLKAVGNIKVGKWLMTSLVLFVVIWLADFLVHGFLLKANYAASARLFLSEAAMMARMPYMLIGQALYALILVLIYSQGYTGKGSIMEGVRYGVYIGLLMNIPSAFMSYSWSLYPVNLIVLWAAYGFAQFVVYGAVIGAMYKGK